jgi:hypothetical protein
MNENKQYLGDAVYADFDGYHIVLTTGNGVGGFTNRIYLEPAVLAALNRYVDALTAKLEHNEEPPK